MRKFNAFDCNELLHRLEFYSFDQESAGIIDLSLILKNLCVIVIF